MKKYIKPEMEINELNMSDTLLLTGSIDGKSILEDGGSTNEWDITEADSKLRGEGFSDLLW